MKASTNFEKFCSPIRVTTIIAGAIALIGCGSSGGGTNASNGADAESVSGVVVDQQAAAPTDGDMTILWKVASESPDYTYVTNGGSFKIDTFTLTLPSPIPPEAINTGFDGVAVGNVFGFAVGSAPVDGRLPDDEDSSFDFSPFGAVERYAVIYRSAVGVAEPVLSWVSAFPMGYSCGLGVNAVDGESFDTFVPVDCGEMVFRVGDISTFNFVDWT